MNGGVNIDTKKYFDTIVIRRPTGLTGNDFAINLRELQCWVNGVNIMIDNDLTSYFADWSVDKQVDIGFFTGSPVNALYNNIIETDFGTASSGGNVNTAVIIKNIPITAIYDIQALVLYNRTGSGFKLRTIGLAIELYNSTNDPDLTEVLATTNVITSGVNIYRFDFPSLSTYTDFVGVNSITNIVSNSIASTEEANVFFFTTEITGEVWGGDLSVVGDLTAENLIVGSTNVITELISLHIRLDIEEPKTTALQTLTASHTEDIATNTADILTKQDTIQDDYLTISKTLNL